MSNRAHVLVLLKIVKWRLPPDYLQRLYGGFLLSKLETPLGYKFISVLFVDLMGGSTEIIGHFLMSFENASLISKS